MELDKEIKYLVMVDANDNHNKDYKMIHVVGEPFFNVEYGRIGARKATGRYPINCWDTKYSEKLKKGYQDRTNMISVNVASSNGNGKFADIKDPECNTFVARLLSWAGEHIKRNYTISSTDVTVQMVTESQNIIDKMRITDENHINAYLQHLFSVLPRKMKNVNENLFKNGDNVDEIIDREQQLLDVMAAKVDTTVIQSQSSSTGKDILDATGLDMRVVTEKEMSEIKEHLGLEASKVVRAYYVRNRETEEKFQNYCKERNIKKYKYLYHGSMNENFWNIYKTGMKLHPNAKTAGKMFGFGLYFASEPRKSLRYTSLRGNNNLHGNTGNTGLLAVFKVATGNAKHISMWSPEMSTYTEESMKKFGVDSVFAHKGGSLINDEMIIYNENACTIRYLIELKN